MNSYGFKAVAAEVIWIHMVSGPLPQKSDEFIWRPAFNSESKGRILGLSSCVYAEAYAVYIYAKMLPSIRWGLRRPASQRNKVTETQKHWVTETQGHRHTQTQKHRVTETQKHRVTETQGHKDTETQRHRVTETQKHWVTETQSHRDTDTQKHRVTETQIMKTQSPHRAKYTT